MQKLLNWLVKVHQNSPFTVHKTISRFVGWSVFLPLYNSSSLGYEGPYDLVYFGYCWLAISTLVVDLFFLVKGQEESVYKSDSFFERNKITRQSIDRYYKWITITKSVIIIPMFIFYDVIHYGFISLIMVPVIASIFKFKPFMPDEKGASPSSARPHWYGAPGYDMSGNLTGSPTATGGMSN